MRINQEKQLGSGADCKSRVPVQETKASKPLDVKTVGAMAGETASLIGGAHGGLEYTQANPPGNQHDGSTSKAAIHF